MEMTLKRTEDADADVHGKGEVGELRRIELEEENVFQKLPGQS